MIIGERRRCRGSAEVDAETPATWRCAEPHPDEAGQVDLLLIGPGSRWGRSPRLRVIFEEGTDRIDQVANRIWEELRERCPHSLLASQDIWPHPYWGEGRLVQTARIEAGIAVAHDCYIFVEGHRTIRIEIECALADLLTVEEEVADIVSHVRPKADRR
ncbi:hypothetical protein SAMN05421595_0342 [Austwickia chelonae]|uniref:Uncharacterized protein n=1 Tax=Austwickia chelonae NBRC 105200 TaxID=1184607 RepID=K6V6G7_9MICO|nr:hypothetical protein [Austwickia chelonae]GAB77833.1 hypothetical protein AUCHE_08_00750 [Austwickia chelonae NBRC 105200]SEV90435.1 hypothetical protein SAMN05421595_0342 [Austwickia chelonae]